MNQLKKYLAKYCPALLLIGLIVLCPLKLILVQGISMSPTFSNNQILLALKVDSNTKLNKDDIVVILFESQYIIKRIKFIENDMIYYHYDLNNNTLKFISKDEFIKLTSIKKEFPSHDLLTKISVMHDQFYLLGDNRNFSDDSRRFGLIDKNNILYKIIYPLNGDPNNVKK